MYPKVGIAGSLLIILKMEKQRRKDTNPGHVRHGAGRSRKIKAVKCWAMELE